MRITGISYLIMSNLTQTANAAEDVKGEISIAKSEAYSWSVDGRVLNVKAVALRQILRNKYSTLKNDQLDYMLEKLDWQMLARAVAKDVYGKELNNDQAADLAGKLQVANGGSEVDIPAKVLVRENPLTGGESACLVSRGVSANQYNAYLGTKDTAKCGRFPPRLPVVVPQDFITEVNSITAPVAVQPKQPEPQQVSDNATAAKAPAESGCKWFKVQVAVFKPESMAFRLADKLDPLLKGINADYKAYVQDNGNGLWGVYVGEFSKNEFVISSRKDAGKMLTDLTKILQGKPDLSELKPFVKSDDQCGLSIATPEEPARNSAQFFKVWVGTFMDKARVDSVSSQLRAKGFEAYVRKFDGGVYLVQAGAFMKQGNAETMLRDIKARLCEEPGSDLCKMEPVIKQPRSINREGDVK